MSLRRRHCSVREVAAGDRGARRARHRKRPREVVTTAQAVYVGVATVAVALLLGFAQDR